MASQAPKLTTGCYQTIYSRTASQPAGRWDIMDHGLAHRTASRAPHQADGGLDGCGHARPGHPPPALPARPPGRLQRHLPSPSPGQQAAQHPLLLLPRHRRPGRLGGRSHGLGSSTKSTSIVVCSQDSGGCCPCPCHAATDGDGDHTACRGQVGLRGSTQPLIEVGGATRLPPPCGRCSRCTTRTGAPDKLRDGALWVLGRGSAAVRGGEGGGGGGGHCWRYCCGGFQRGRKQEPRRRISPFLHVELHPAHALQEQQHLGSGVLQACPTCGTQPTQQPR
jgi:hypothetical protein